MMKACQLAVTARMSCWSWCKGWVQTQKQPMSWLISSVSCRVDEGASGVFAIFSLAPGRFTLKGWENISGFKCSFSSL